MSKKTVELVYGTPQDSPSVKNISQGLRALGERWEVKDQPVRPNFPGTSDLISISELGTYQINLIRRWVQMRLSNPSDIVIIHKPFLCFVPDMAFNTNIAEKLYSCAQKVVYSTYDATYVQHPNKVRYLFKNSDLVYATSKAIEAEAKKYAPEERVAYIPPSVDTKFFTPKKSTPDHLRSDSTVLGWIGKAEQHLEDIQLLTEVLQELNSNDFLLRLLLGGEDLPPDVQSELANLAIDVDLIDWVPWDEVPRVINSFDIGLAPLDDTEFNRARSSEKVREYMACGIPVIASDVGENKFLIPEDGGQLVSSKEQWIHAVDKLSVSETNSRSAEIARNHVMMNYSIEAISKKIRSEFSQLVSYSDGIV